MGNISEWVRSHTHELLDAIRQFFIWAPVVGLITHDFAGRPWDENRSALTVSVVSAICSLIAAKTTVAAWKVDQRIAEAKAKGIAMGTTIEEARAEGLLSGTGDGTRP